MQPELLQRRLRATGLTPLVRATHSQLEVTLLPPYGDPEVSIPGELATYAVVGGLVVELLERAGE